MSDSGKDSVRKYRATPKGRIALLRQEARRSKVEWGLDEVDVKGLLRQPCTYCGGKAQTLDRATPDWGYIPGNVVPCCLVCKRSKGNMSKGAFFLWVAQVYKRFAYKKFRT